MIIGIDASRANRKYKSGTEWYSYYFIKELAKIDKKNKYILYTDTPLSEDLIDLTSNNIFGQNNGGIKTKVSRNGCQTIKSPYNNFQAKVLKWPLPFFWTLIRLSWEMLIHEPDVLFIPAHTLPLIHPKKSVVTIHDVGFERERKLYSQDEIGPERPFLRKIINFLAKLFTGGKYGANILDYYSWSTKFSLKHAKKIITVSNFSKKEILETFNAPADKIKVIHNGYNNKLYKKITDPDKIQQVLDKYDIKTPFVFYVGRLEKKKNISNLVNAYAIMREKYKNIKHKLVLAGSASYGYDEVNYAIQEFNINDEVIITGWVDEEDMPFIYNSAAVFIFPSFYEGFGIPLLQAMACGTPIAASCVASMPEIASRAALFFDPNNKQEMADAIANIISNNDLRNELINYGNERIKNFSWEKCAQETFSLLTEL